MKKIITAIISLSLVLTLFTACGKEQAAGTEAELNTLSGRTLTADMKLPKSFKGSWTGVDGLVTVKADGEVKAESLDMPCGNVSRHSFTNEEAQKFAELFLDGRTLYEPQKTSKQDIEAHIKKLEAALAGETKLDGDGAEKTPEEIQELIDYYKNELKTAPDENAAPKPMPIEFREDDFFSGIIEGWTEGKNGIENLVIVNFPQFADFALCYKEEYGDKNSDYAENLKYFGNDISPEIKLNDAEKQAEKLIEALGLDFALESAEPVAFTRGNTIVCDENEEPEQLSPDETGWRMYYVRNVQGHALKRCGMSGSAIAENEQTDEVLCWPYEHIEVCVNGDGVVYFKWYSPYDEPVIESLSSPLMDFNDIEDIFEKMIMVKNSGIKEQNRKNKIEGKLEIEVERVELNLARVRNMGELGEGKLVPVWDFIGSSRYVYENTAQEEPETTAVLSINAIDGTIIDRETGI